MNDDDMKTKSETAALLFEHAALVTAKPLTFDNDTDNDTNQTNEN